MQRIVSYLVALVLAARLTTAMPFSFGLSDACAAT